MMRRELKDAFDYDGRLTSTNQSRQREIIGDVDQEKTREIDNNT